MHSILIKQCVIYATFYSLITKYYTVRKDCNELSLVSGWYYNKCLVTWMMTLIYTIHNDIDYINSPFSWCHTTDNHLYILGLSWTEVTASDITVTRREYFIHWSNNTWPDHNTTLTLLLLDILQDILCLEPKKTKEFLYNHFL